MSDLDPSKEVFDNYLPNYVRSANGKHFKPADEVRAYHLDRLPRWIGEVPRDARILDAGCATGYLLSLLADEGFSCLCGVDISEQLVDVARKNLPQEVFLAVSSINGYLSGLEDESLDVVIFHHVLEHIPRDQTINLLREFRRVLSPGGRLSLKVPNASCLLGGVNAFRDFTHIVYFNEFSIFQILELAGFDANNIQFVLHPPLLFWSWKHPVRACLRFMNRVRWMLHRGLHYIACALVDLHPVPKSFEIELEALVRR